MTNLFWENSISNSLNAHYYFRGSVKCVNSSSLEIRCRLRPQDVFVKISDIIQ